MICKTVPYALKQSNLFRRPPYPTLTTTGSPRRTPRREEASARFTNISRLPQELMTAPGSAVEPAS